MMNALEQLQEMTVIVADTGDSALLKEHQPQDCTTNPSLVLAALNSTEAEELITEEVEKARKTSLCVEELCNTLTVAIGANLASLVPGGSVALIRLFCVFNFTSFVRLPSQRNFQQNEFHL